MALALLILFLAPIGAGAWRALQPLPAAHAQLQPLALRTQALPLAWPPSGQAAIEAEGVGPLLLHGAQVPVPTASVAKLITGLAVVQHNTLATGQPGPTITLTDDDVARYQNYIAQDGSVVRVAAGEQLTERQALEAMILPSANNMADSLAAWAFGSLPQYRVYAQAMVRQLGMAHTTVGTDAGGLSPTTTSTTADLLILAKRVLADPTLAAIVQEQGATLPVAGYIPNINQPAEPGIIGIKTGHSDEAGGAFVFASNYAAGGKTTQIVGAVLAQPNRDTALQAGSTLLASAKANIAVLSPIRKNQTVAVYTAAWHAQANAISTQDISFVIWKGTPLHTTLTGTGTAAPATVAITGAAQPVHIPLVFAKPLARPSLWWRVVR